ncbi:hypothetical protein [Mesobacillus boroniphilus]|nr:hypothetical protein [Mesobacillus boroniphilus]
MFLLNGQEQIVANLPKLRNDLTGISAGQQQLLAGFGTQLNQLTDVRV